MTFFRSQILKWRCLNFQILHIPHINRVAIENVNVSEHRRFYDWLILSESHWYFYHYSITWDQIFTNRISVFSWKNLIFSFISNLMKHYSMKPIVFELWVICKFNRRHFEISKCQIFKQFSFVDYVTEAICTRFYYNISLYY